MKYSKKKEVQPLDTISKIKNTLRNIGLETKVSFLGGTPDSNMDKPVYSCRVYVDNPFVGQNGKGTTPDYTRASGYAELIERFQNWCVFSEKFPLPDEVDVPLAEFINQNPDCVNQNFFTYLYNGLTNSTDSSSVTIEDKIKLLYDYLDMPDVKGFNCVKFYSVSDKKSVYLPYNPITRITNGMCAGNTPVEALVQGLSEVLERYVAQEIHVNSYICPLVPEEEYSQYEDISAIINMYNKLGFTVQIRDASLGKKYPVIAVALIDKETNKYTVKFGAHPSLPISIERCLTELAQGFALTREALIKDSTFNPLTPNFDIFKLDVALIKRLLHLTRYPFGSRFFLESSSWNFDRTAWYDEELSNNEIFQKLLSVIKQQTSEIYIRNVAFLNFPAFHIVIPKMTLMRDEIICYECFDKVYKEAIKEDYKDLRLSKNLVAIAYFIEVKDYNSAITLIDRAIEENDHIPEEKQRLSNSELACLKQILNHKIFGYSNDEIEKIIQLFYKDDVGSEIYKKWFINSPFDSISITEEEVAIKNALNKLYNSLLNAYKDNIPSQDIIGDIVGIDCLCNKNS